ncbi:MAG TPA: right-handed parallel beta-helix repeat-containing protein [Terriglobales bacterium]|nr:right-handed parallel beta-helix repeat-containing protein [Terriglobales bacterium]
MPTVGVYSSHGVTLENLTIENGAPGLLVTQQSQVVLRNSVVQKNAPNGVDVLIGSVLEVDGGSIIDNQRNGLRTDSSVVWVGPERLFIARNLGGAGLNVVASDIEVNNGALTVEDNNTAVSVVSGRLTLFGPATGDGVIFQNNKAGLNFVNASAFRVASAFVIRNNGQIGIRMAGSSAQIGSPGVIEGHSINGVSVGSLSRFTITGGMTRIQNNGNSTNPERGGIRLDGGASLDATNITISENGGFGLLAIQNSRMTIGDATISNNSDAGVTVRRLSSAHFDNPPVISSSGRASIVCDTTSLVSGNLTGVAGIDCSRIEREVGPPHDGTVH